ncbi:uncharacterized protein LOC129292953 [Prosopis cineraria]|uniref:uncharacterized protein LOC129292953 n=1 Tax=Prosopis cineraria TaxID=364024 RepID=UPI00240F7058|nr:uncharacterized protein LOC129292953 [Prosopis cineraria]
MATALRNPTFRPPLPTLSSTSHKPLCVSLRHPSSFRPFSLASLQSGNIASPRVVKFVPFAFDGEAETAEAQEIHGPEVLDSSDGVVGAEDNTGDSEVIDAEETPVSPLLTLFQSYKEAVAENDETKITELESLLKSIEDENNGLERKVTSLSQELSIEKDRILRISADFDNFRKRTERERLSLVTNAEGEVVESLLPVLDNFERAKTQIKVETEGEEKINNSYQNIYKQFIEILTSLGVEPVETVGKPFDPLLHEAIMREDSAEFEEDIIIEEFRKGFKLGERLLRPSMVKVSAGPGPAKREGDEPQEQDTSEMPESSQENEGSAESESV